MKKAKKSIPVVTELATAYVDKKTGLRVECNTLSKGLLNQTTQSIISEDGADRWHEIEPRDSHEIAVDWMRDAKRSAQRILSDAGLPTDHNSNLYGVLKLKKRISPLSKEESAAKLIDTINRILETENKEIAFLALQFGDALYSIMLNDGLNDIAMDWHKINEGRIGGGDWQVKAFLRNRGVIEEICRRRWSVEIIKTRGANTSAKEIATEVNTKLENPIKLTTIATHIREIFGIRKAKRASKLVG